MATNKTNTLETRIAGVLGNGRAASQDLYRIIAETDVAIQNADEAAKAQRLRALDVLASPNASEAREALQEAEFSRDRLRHVLPKLKTHLENMLELERHLRWQADFERAAKASEIAAVKVGRARDLINQLVDICRTAAETDKLIAAVNLSAPAAESRRLREHSTLLRKLVLCDFDSGQKLWPPVQTLDVEKFAPKEPYNRRYTGDWWREGAEQAEKQRQADEFALQQAEKEKQTFYQGHQS